MKIEEKRKPLASKDNIAIWAADDTSSGKKIFKASIDQLSEGRKYVTVFPNISSIELTAEQVLEIMHRNKVTVNGSTEKGHFECTVVNRGIVTSQFKKDDNIYHNHTLNLGVAYHKKDQNGHLYGYSCNGVGFFINAVDKEDEINLNIEDCFNLLDGKTIFKDNRQAFLNFSRTNGDYKAKEQTSENQEQKTENPGHTHKVNQQKTARLTIQKDARALGREENFFAQKH